MANYKKGDRVIATAEYNWVSKGTKGVVVEEGWAFGSPKVAFEGGKTLSYPADKMAKI